jgi:hypothetical protein
VIRPFGLRDVFALRQLQPRGTAFDIKSWLLSNSTSSRDALISLLTHGHLGTLTYLSQNSHGLRQGFAQVCTRPNGLEWDLRFLAPSLDDHRDASEIWQGLLSHLIIVAGQQNVLRIYARTSEDTETEALFRGAGFTMVSREEVFVLSQPAAPAPLPKGMRPAGRGDYDALVHLCQEAMPALIRKAEASAADWCGARTLALRSSERSRPQDATSFVCLDKGATIGYLSTRHGPAGYWLEVIAHPDHRGDMLPYVRYMLSLTECGPSAPVYASVLDSSVGLGWILRALDFVSYSRQVLFVAHPVVRVPVRRTVVIPGLEGSVESLGPQIRGTKGC